MSKASHRTVVTETSDVVTTEAEEMYLITIAMAIEEGHEGPVPVPQIAKALGVSRVSANEMVKKLAARELVDYVRYKGVRLSSVGEEIARRVLRRRRLWSVFLSEQLGLSPKAADAVACEFEHITPADVAQRLAEFLGEPTVSPQGKPIPTADAAPTNAPAAIPIGEAQVSRPVEVVAVEADAAGRSFLAEQGIVPGSRITLLAVAEGGACLVAAGEGRVHVSAELADAVRVLPAS
ncbi:MAG TPA: metal-dependent transcriptional regulator [Actinobacteria bacterium]|nr:metal-dependent transcriptional regulator [Actinomycetota bacterium]